jgi:hypothetical protein
MRHRRTILAAAAAISAVLVATAVPASADVCTAIKLKAVGKLQSALLSCQAKMAATNDRAKLEECRTKALEKFDEAFAKSGTCSGEEPICLGLAVQCESEVSGVIDAETLPSKCTAVKRKAAARLAGAVLGCHSKAAKKDIDLDPTCVDKAVLKFDAALVKADADGACPDGGAPQALVQDYCVAQDVVVDEGAVTQACPEKDCSMVEDYNFCTVDSCDPVSGVSHTPIDMDDDDACTTDTCTPDGSGQGIYHTPVSVDDGDACTTDSCDPETGVSHTPVNIDDGDACTADSCTPSGSSSGVSHTPISPDDGNPCTTDSCDPVTGVSHTPVDPDDGDACTTDSCDPSGGAGGGVSNTPVDPDDGNPCTVDSCDPATGVSHTPVDIDDGDACTTDACDPSGGTSGGVSHTPVSTDDGNPCTADSCDPSTGVVSHLYTGDDGACPLGQVCSMEGCVIE